MGIDIDKVRTSQSYAYTIWKAYRDNPGGSEDITAADIKEIENIWGKATINRWIEIYDNDDNEYEFPDDDFSNSYDKGVDKAKNDSGASGEADSVGLGNAGSYVMGGLGAAGSLSLSIGGMSLLGLESVKGLTGDALTKVQNTNKTPALIAAGIILAFATLYAVIANAFSKAHYNQEQINALTEFKDSILPDADDKLKDVQSGIDDKVGELEDLSEDAETTNDESNEEIKDKKAEFDVYMLSYQYLYEKVQNGEQLTPDEMQFLQDLGRILTELGLTIEDLTKVTEEDVKAVFENMEDYEGVFEEYSEKMAEVLGTTDFMAQFDEATVGHAQTAKTIAEIGAWTGPTTILAANAIVIAKAAAAIAGFFTAPIGIAAMAMATASTFLSGWGAKEFSDAAGEQKNFKTIAEEAVAAREATQGLNDQTNDIFDDGNDIWGDYKELIGELTLEVPTDEEMEIPEAPQGGQGGGGTPVDGGNPVGGGNNPVSGGGNPVSGGNPFAPPVTDNNQGNNIKDNNQSNVFANTIDILNNNLDAAEIQFNDGNKVILAPQYINAICSVTGWPDQNSGPKFNTSFIPAIIAKIAALDESIVETVMNGNEVDSKYANDVLKTLTGKKSASGESNNSKEVTEKLNQIIKYYEPIIAGAAANGWCRQ